MRRIAFTLVVLCLAGVSLLVASAGAGDKNTYDIEFDNAFGLVNGSEVRIAGVKAGTVKELDINEAKKALITIEVEGEFGEFKSDAECSSEPQSLIAEYFVDCQPGQSPDPLEGPLPVEQTTITVPNDLVQNTLREPFKRGLALVINEFGTALTGNAENLNAAILRGAPALRDLKQVTSILANQNTVIRDLNANSDTIIARLNDNREDVVRFVEEANDTAEASAERRDDLSKDFELLPGFLAELKPTMFQLGKLADNGRPVLSELRRSAGNLNRLADLVIPFNDATNTGLTSLGGAAEVGTRALTKGQDEINLIRSSTTNALPAADKLAQFFESIDDPMNAVEEDERARDDLVEQPGEADRRVQLLRGKAGPNVTDPGYTGMEGLLNYAYYQTGALNQFDMIGHLLHFTLFEPLVTSPCGHVHAEGNYGDGTGGTDPQSAPPCVSVLGDNQPGVNTYTNPSGLTGNLQRYDDSVCPQGSTNLAVCDPSISTHGPSTRRAQGRVGDAPAAPSEELQEALTPEVLEDIQQGEPVPDDVQDALDTPEGQALLDQVGGDLGALLDQTLGGLGGGSSRSTDQQTATQLLDFLFGS